MDEDGNLNWDVPQGEWTILRMGYALTSAMVRAGTDGEHSQLIVTLSSLGAPEYGPWTNVAERTVHPASRVRRAATSVLRPVAFMRGA